MVAITDLFGKASIDTDYALATTVKTARTSGESVLACYDLSRFPQDTPAYFITYKKTTDPTTGEVSVTNQTSWKALVNPDNNTLTNLTLAPGYTDIGNDIGDFVECIPTSYWGNELVKGLLTSHNPDGTLKVITENPGWTPLTGLNLTNVSNKGNREYQFDADADLTTVLTPGMRLKVTRGTAAPTQVTSLNGTNQYWRDTTPAGMTFTDDFTVSAWVKLDSYGGGVIASRYNGASGWFFMVESDGKVQVVGFNGSGSNFRGIRSYQSLPLNKWVHVAIQEDMSAHTNTPTTCYLMIDGVDVPSELRTGGTNPTSLVQAGNLEVGSWNGGLLPFPGKIAHVAIYSAKITQATIRSRMNQVLAGSETGLVAAYTFNGNGNDLSANANHLEAMNAAVATDADNPMKDTEYAIVTKVGAFAAGVTPITVFTGTDHNIPNMTLSNPQYSTQRAPFGFPASKEKWEVRQSVRTNNSVTPPAGAVNISSIRMAIPSGVWRLGFNGAFQAIGPLQPMGLYAGLSSSSSSEDYVIERGFMHIDKVTSYIMMIAKEGSYTRPDASTVYLLIKRFDANTTTAAVAGAYSPFEIFAECAYL